MYRHLPNLIENNKVFQFLFLIRKLFFINVSRKSYSQFGEDISLGHISNHTDKGTFVDVGCFHPKKYNNTYILYKKGWRGINIDMDEIKIKGFNILRSKDKNICVAITNDSQKTSVTMYSFGFYTLINSLDREFAQKRGGYKEKTVKCSTLNKILKDNKFSKVDLLSIDAEGYDLNVIKSIDLQVYRVETIIVEQHTKFLEEVMECELYKYITSQGYSLVNWTGPSLLFQKKTA